jgi:hypothetical protein
MSVALICLPAATKKSCEGWKLFCPGVRVFTCQTNYIKHRSKKFLMGGGEVIFKVSLETFGRTDIPTDYRVVDINIRP